MQFVRLDPVWTSLKETSARQAIPDARQGQQLVQHTVNGHANVALRAQPSGGQAGGAAIVASAIGPAAVDVRTGLISDRLPCILIRFDWAHERYL